MAAESHSASLPLVVPLQFSDVWGSLHLGLCSRRLWLDNALVDIHERLHGLTGVLGHSSSALCKGGAGCGRAAVLGLR